MDTQDTQYPSAKPETWRRHVATAEAMGAVAVYRVRYELEAARCPAWLRAEARASGCELVRLGSTTYRSSTWGLVPHADAARAAGVEEAAAGVPCRGGT